MNTKSIAIVVGLGLVTASAMAALVAGKMHTTAICRDVRVAMEGGIDAYVQTSQLTSRTAVTLFKLHNYKHIPIGTVDVSPVRNPQAKGGETFVAPNLKLTIAKNVDRKTGRQPASLQGVVDGKKVSLALGCSN